MSRGDWQTTSGRPLRGHVLLREDEEPGGPHLWRRLLVLLLVAGLIGGGLALYFSSVLRVQEVQVTGARTLDAYSLAELADLKGDSMFTVPLDDAQERLAALPMVKSVKAERHWPHTVRLVVEERQPWAQAKDPDRSAELDETLATLARGLTVLATLLFQLVGAASPRMT